MLFAQPIADWLLGGGVDSSLVVWAAIAGGAGAVYRVASITIWLERRPYPYIAVEASRPLLTLLVVVPLLIAGGGLEGAIVGTGAGSALATIFALILLRGSWTPTFDLSEAIAIYRKGAIRVPLVVSMWVVGYADIFILSRFVSDTDLGTYHLASRAGFLVSFLPAGLPQGAAAAAEDGDLPGGRGRVRGRQRPRDPVRLLRADADRGDARGHRASRTRWCGSRPQSYADAAPLIPLLVGRAWWRRPSTGC